MASVVARARDTPECQRPWHRAFNDVAEHEILKASSKCGTQEQKLTSEHVISVAKSFFFGPLGLLQLAVVAVPLSTGMHNPFEWLWRAYCASLTTYPLATKIATGAMGTFLGDLLAQVTQYNTSGTEQPFKYEPFRCLRLMFFSVVVATPWAIFWYGLLDKMVLPGQEGVHVMVAKMGVDQFLATPFFIGFFLAASKALEGKPNDAIPFVKTALLPTLLANWKLWPLAMLFNFSIVPPDMRILFVNVVALLWTSYLSITVNSPKTDTTA